MVTTAKASASAAKFVDAQLHTVASAVERFANIVTATTGDAESRLGSFGEPVSRGLEKAAAKLRSHDGEYIVDGVKTQMLQHPKATVGIAAAVGAIAAQAALMMFKSELPKNAAIRPVKSVGKNGASKNGANKNAAGPKKRNAKTRIEANEPAEI